MDHVVGVEGVLPGNPKSSSVGGRKKIVVVKIRLVGGLVDTKLIDDVGGGAVGFDKPLELGRGHHPGVSVEAGVGGDAYIQRPVGAHFMKDHPGDQNSREEIQEPWGDVSPTQASEEFAEGLLGEKNRNPCRNHEDWHEGDHSRGTWGKGPEAGGAPKETGPQEDSHTKDGNRGTKAGKKDSQTKKGKGRHEGTRRGEGRGKIVAVVPSIMKDTEGIPVVMKEKLIQRPDVVTIPLKTPKFTLKVVSFKKIHLP